MFLVRNLDYTTKGGFYVSQISEDTDENGGRAEFTVSLSSAPEDNVTITMATSDDSEGVILTTIGNSQTGDNATQPSPPRTGIGQDGDGGRSGGQLIRRRSELRDCADRRQ